MRALLLSKTEARSTKKMGKKIRDIPMVTGKFVLGPLTVISGRRNAPNDNCAIVARCVIHPSTDVGDPSNETYLSSMAVDSDAFTDRTKNVHHINLNVSHVVRSGRNPAEESPKSLN